MGDNVGSFGYYWDFYRSHFYYLDCIFRDIVFSFSFIVLLNNGSIGLCLSILLLYLLSFQNFFSCVLACLYPTLNVFIEFWLYSTVC